MLIKRSEPGGELRVIAAQYLVDFRAFVFDNATRPGFMMKAEDLLYHVRKRSVSEVVQQRAGATNDARFVADRVLSREQIERPRHQVHHADGVGEAAVFGSLISEQRDAELLDAAQPLELCRANQVDDQTII